MYSGTRSAKIKRSAFSLIKHLHLLHSASHWLIPRLSTGSGILGWRDAQVHNNVVARQLQMISHLVRQSLISRQLLDPDSSAVVDTGAARTRKKWTRSSRSISEQDLGLYQETKAYRPLYANPNAIEIQSLASTSTIGVMIHFCHNVGPLWIDAGTTTIPHA